MKSLAILTLGLSFLLSLPAAAESTSASASLGKYDVEMHYRIPARFQSQTPTIHTEDDHDGFNLRCVSNLEFTGATLQVRLYKAGTRELVTSRELPLKLGRTESVSINEEIDCKKPADFEKGIQSIGVRDSGIEIPLPGTSQAIRLRIESGQALAEGRFTRDGDAYQLVGFRMDPPASASLYWDLYDLASRKYLLTLQKSEAHFTKTPAKDLIPHAPGTPATHR